MMSVNEEHKIDEEARQIMGNVSQRRKGYGPIPEEIKGNDEHEDPMQINVSDTMEINVSDSMNRNYQVASDQIIMQSKWILGFLCLVLTFVFTSFITYHKASHHAYSAGTTPEVSLPINETTTDSTGSYHQGLTNGDPWGINGDHGGVFGPPKFFDSNETSVAEPVGYFSQPDLRNDTLVFVAEGDLYVTTLKGYTGSESLSALRLTSTEGNTISPKVSLLSFIPVKR